MRTRNSIKVLPLFLLLAFLLPFYQLLIENEGEKRMTIEQSNYHSTGNWININNETLFTQNDEKTDFVSNYNQNIKIQITSILNKIRMEGFIYYVSYWNQ